MSTSPSSQVAQVPVAAAPSTSIVAPVLAIMLGMLIVGVAGFSHLEIVHNAAHDTRHSNAFPCH